jgi:hypothetical protein
MEGSFCRGCDPRAVKGGFILPESAYQSQSEAQAHPPGRRLGLFDFPKQLRAAVRDWSVVWWRECSLSTPGYSKENLAAREHFPVCPWIDGAEPERGISQGRVPDAGNEALDLERDRPLLGIIGARTQAQITDPEEERSM